MFALANNMTCEEKHPEPLRITCTKFFESRCIGQPVLEIGASEIECWRLGQVEMVVWRACLNFREFQLDPVLGISSTLVIHCCKKTSKPEVSCPANSPSKWGQGSQGEPFSSMKKKVEHRFAPASTPTTSRARVLVHSQRGSATLAVRVRDDVPLFSSSSSHRPGILKSRCNR